MQDEITPLLNKLPNRCIENLYLNPKGADVNFIFASDSDDPEKVSAHKNILSISPVFDTMFYGSLPESSNINIVDASAEAFKEFLQFFYMKSVKLTWENIFGVINLSIKYEVDEALKICENLLMYSLPRSKFCFGYNIAVFFERNDLIMFMESKIQRHAAGILKSESFLECNRNQVAKILELVLKKLPASKVVDACIEWASAECLRNDLEVNSKVLRDQIGDIFDRIPFDNMSMDEFRQFIARHKGFFSAEELERSIECSRPKESEAKSNQNKRSREEDENDNSAGNKRTNVYISETDETDEADNSDYSTTEGLENSESWEIDTSEHSEESENSPIFLDSEEPLERSDESEESEVSEDVENLNNLIFLRESEVEVSSEDSLDTE